MANQFFKNWEVTLILDGKRVTGKGGDMLQCLKKIRAKADLDKIKLYGTFEVKIDDKVSVIPLRFGKAKLQQTFFKDVYLEIFAKRLDVLR